MPIYRSKSRTPCRIRQTKALEHVKRKGLPLRYSYTNLTFHLDHDSKVAKVHERVLENINLCSLHYIERCYICKNIKHKSSNFYEII